MPGSGAPIVLDAMGGDHAPREQVAGAVAAVREHGVRMVLAGDARTLWSLLDEHGAAPDIEVVHAAEVIPMGDSGVRMRGLPGTSAAVACGLVAGGQAGALVSAGSTGGTVATAVATLGCAPGVLRPAIAVLLPTAGRGTVLLDAGATADPTPEMLAQFGCSGRATPAPSWVSSRPPWACSRSAPSRAKVTGWPAGPSPCSAPRRSGSPATWKGATPWPAPWTSWSPTASPATWR
jgi:fatty acid/phospholipid biosynthesis enzyme